MIAFDIDYIAIGAINYMDNCTYLINKKDCF